MVDDGGAKVLELRMNHEQLAYARMTTKLKMKTWMSSLIQTKTMLHRDLRRARANHVDLVRPLPKFRKLQTKGKNDSSLVKSDRTALTAVTHLVEADVVHVRSLLRFLLTSTVFQRGKKPSEHLPSSRPSPGRTSVVVVVAVDEGVVEEAIGTAAKRLPLESLFKSN